MLSVNEAQEKVLACVRPLGVLREALPRCLGLVLAEDVASDLDMPPYDKAMVDGYAVRSGDLREGRGELAVVEEVHAGAVPSVAIGAGQATRIMTGAPVPAGADAVVMVEQTQIAADGRSTSAPDAVAPAGVRVESPGSVKAGQNIMARGLEMRRGQVVLRAGAEIRPQEIGLLAAVGRSEVQVCRPARVAVLSTGDELVEAGQVPRQGQIRNSNGPTLTALVARAGAEALYFGIARDNIESLHDLIGRGLQEADVLVLSGGVSAGLKDLVPTVLGEQGVVEVFHKIALKPGKPIWFGKKDATLVFGLPGNPVSALVCFELFVRPAIRRLMGHREVLPRPVTARLAEDKLSRSDRPTYHPAALTWEGADGYRVRPVEWLGAPDLRATTEANALVLLPAGDHQHRAGDRVQVIAMS